LRDTDRFAWPGLEGLFEDIYSPVARFFRQSWYNPARVVAAGADGIRRTFCDLIDLEDDFHWVDYLSSATALVT
jgi:hypothetical protein